MSAAPSTDLPIETLVRSRIRESAQGCVPFSAIMELALYHSRHGYYGPRPRHIGRSGDFFTAVSVGPLYGRLLAMLAEQVWRGLGSPGRFCLIEQGANDGQLMEDIARGFREYDSPLADAARLFIVEPNAAHQAAQAGRLQPLLGNRIHWVRGAEELRAHGVRHAFFFANELFDALPVHRVRWNGVAWEELRVSLEGNGFTWTTRPVKDADLATELAGLQSLAVELDIEPGHMAESCPRATQTLAAMCGAGFDGAVLIADYGLDEREFLEPQRRNGTLRRYHQHHMDDCVLENLGACDLTAHVHFGRLAQTAEQAGFGMLEYEPQGKFLTRLASPWLRSIDGAQPSADTAALLRQFQTLTHPGHMGASFRMMLLGRGVTRQGGCA